MSDKQSIDNDQVSREIISLLARYKVSVVQARRILKIVREILEFNSVVVAEEPDVTKDESKRPPPSDVLSPEEVMNLLSGQDGNTRRPQEETKEEPKRARRPGALSSKEIEALLGGVNAKPSPLTTEELDALFSSKPLPYSAPQPSCCAPQVYCETR
jgi:hypothetical protein